MDWDATVIDTLSESYSSIYAKAAGATAVSPPGDVDLRASASWRIRLSIPPGQ